MVYTSSCNSLKVQKSFPEAIPSSRQTMFEMAKHFIRQDQERTDHDQEGQKLGEAQKTFNEWENHLATVQENHTHTHTKRASSELKIARTTLQGIMKELQFGNWKSHLE